MSITKKKNYKAENTIWRDRASIRTRKAGLLELSKWEFKTDVTKMLGDLMEKVDSMQKQMGNISREMEILRFTKKEHWILKKQKTLTVITKSAFNELISRQNMTEGTTWVEGCRFKIVKRENRLEKKIKYSRTYEHLQKIITYSWSTWKPEGKEKGTEEISKRIKTMSLILLMSDIIKL